MQRFQFVQSVKNVTIESITTYNVTKSSLFIQFSYITLGRHVLTEVTRNSHLKVHTLSTVGDHTEQPQSLGQILGGLCFTCTCRPGGGTTQVHGQSLSTSITRIDKH